MLTGTAEVAALRTGTVPAWDAPSVELEGVEVVQAMFELRAAGREAVLPPALHPTNPPTAVLQGWRCPSSPWGPFQLAQVRVQCRSGLRPRGFVVGAVVDNADAADGLGRGWGFSAEVGEVRLRRSYDETVLEVARSGRPILSFTGRDPDPLGGGDV